MAAQLVHLPAQVHVAEQLVGQLLQLGPLLGRHRVEHRLHRRHLLGQLLEQLVEALRVLREEVPVLLHELLEARVLAPLATFEHLVERRHHVLHAGEVLGRHLLHRPAHLLEQLVGELLAQAVEQSLEAARRLLRLEVVLLQLADLAGEVVGQEVEAHVAVHRRLACGLGAALVAGALGVLLGLAHGVVDGVALLVDDVVELAGDLVVDTAEVEAVEAVLALAAQLLEQLADALQALAVAVAEALVHHPAQGGVDVAVVQQLVGQLLEQRVAVELEPLLGAVPAGVGETRRHPATVPRPLSGRRSCERKHKRLGGVSWSMRVPRTFVFVDLSGFTNYTAAFGDDAAGRLLSAFRTIVREVASDRGVRIAKWLGDGCMIVAVEQNDAIAFTLDLEDRSAEVISPADPARRHRHRLRVAVRGRRLHRLGRQHGRPAVRHRRAATRC